MTTKSGPSPQISKVMNIGLAAFLIYECVIGYLEADESYDKVWWLLVTPILVANVLRRSPALEVDRRLLVWVICFVSTLHFLAFEGSRERWWAELALIGIILVGDLNLIYLGRSFSIVPARRRIRRGFVYRLMRHPVYSTYICADALFVMLVPSPRNFVVLGLALVLWMVRAELEETLLRKDAVYLAYAKETKWRFLPFVY